MTGVAALAAAHPWPITRPDAPVTTWGWGIDGEDLLRSAIPPDAGVIVEIGTLLGGSARFFAEHWPAAHLFCIDPWFDVTDAADRPFLEHVPELTGYVTGERDGIYRVFLASNWALRHRLTPLRGYSPDLLAPIHRAGIEPSAVYVDGSHRYEDVLADVTTAKALFPAAVLCGDDWHWPGVRHAVGYVAANRAETVHTSGNTWLLAGDGDGARHRAPSARTVGPGEPSLPRRVLGALGRYRRAVAGGR